MADVKGMLEQAAKDRATNPHKAKITLEDALSRVQGDTSLSDSDRAALRKQLQTQLAGLTTAIREQQAEVARLAKEAEDRAAKETRLKAQLGGGSSKSTYNQANDIYKNGNKMLNAYGKLKADKEYGIQMATLEVYKSASQMEEKRITQRFIDSAKREMSKYTKAELALLKALNSTMVPNFNKTPLKDVIELIQEKTGGDLMIYFDEASLKEKDIEYDSDPVTFKVNQKVTIRTILKKLLADRGLTFIIKDAAVQAMVPAKAQDMMESRSYPVGDLIQPITNNGNPYMMQAQRLSNAQGLMLNIVNSIEPASWAINGGKATITYNDATQSIAIRQTAEFHYQRAGLLGQ
jgi:hypothetical protein